MTNQPTQSKSQPNGQPDNLPEDVVALPLRTFSAKISFEKLSCHNRTSVSVTMTQIPLRAANALTSYSVQGKQFDRYCIYETQATQFYTQISRGRQGLESVFISSNFNKQMKPSIRTNVITYRNDSRLTVNRTI